MKTVVALDPLPVELEQFMQRRQALGQDSFDELWEGVYHMTPGPNAAHALVDDELAGLLRPYAKAAGLFGTGIFNLGVADDYRVPDHGYHRERPTGTWVATAAIVVEILSPGDETYEKFDFYAAHLVEEILVVDPARRSFQIWQRTATGAFVETPASALLDASAADLVAAVDWPE